MPYLQLALELARGTRLALAGDLAGIDAIVADEFADLADAGDFRLGSGYLAILRAQAARLRGQTGEALRDQPAGLRGAGDQPGLRRPGARRAGAQAAALRGEAEQAARGDGRLRPARTRRAWRCSTRGGSRPAPPSLAAAGDLPGAASTCVAWSSGCAATASPATRCCVLHDLVRLGRRPTRIGWPDGAPAQTVGRSGSPSCARRVDGPLPALLARHAPAPPRATAPTLLAVADDFAALDLDVYAAEAAAGAVARLREARRSAATADAPARRAAGAAATAAYARARRRPARR